jgi:hypothetical protein
MVHNIQINLNENELTQANLIKKYLTNSTENRCDLYFKIEDEKNNCKVNLKSNYKIPLNKELFDLMDELDLTYKVNFEV